MLNKNPEHHPVIERVSFTVYAFLAYRTRTIEVNRSSRRIHIHYLHAFCHQTEALKNSQLTSESVNFNRPSSGLFLPFTYPSVIERRLSTRFLSSERNQHYSDSATKANSLLFIYAPFCHRTKASIEFVIERIRLLHLRAF